MYRMENKIKSMADHLLKLVIFLVVVMNTQQACHNPNKEISITLVTDALQKGAVCNDWSSAAYYYSPGFGDGVDSWLIYLAGGAWCADDASCMQRLSKGVGSSTRNEKTVPFGAIKSANQTQNPDFYNWNRVHVVYCDSSSFMGLTNDHPNIASRGARIFDAIMDELLHKGMASATDAILSGDSAGGLATILHCDAFRALLLDNSRVKCVSDSGFFIHAPKLHGAANMANYFANVAAYHGFTDKLPSSCTSRMNASLCFFPEYIVRDVKTPLFLVESKFDQFQMPFHYIKDGGHFSECCIANLTFCTPLDLQSMKDYGLATIEILQEIRESSSIGMFVHPCLRHGHFFQSSGWSASYRLRDKTIAQALGDWFYDRSETFQEIDFDHEFPLRCTKHPIM